MNNRLAAPESCLPRHSYEDPQLVMGYGRHRIGMHADFRDRLTWIWCADVIRD